MSAPTDEYAYPEGNPRRDEARIYMMSGVSKMHGILDEAKEIVGGSRNQAYGNPADNHGCTAEMWTSYLRRKGLLTEGAEVSGRDVCWMMILLKASREAHWSQRDNVLDAIGYAANAEACQD